MIFAEPIWLMVLPVAMAAGLWIVFGAERRRRRKLDRLVAARLQGQLAAESAKNRRWLGHLLWLSAALWLLVSLARPQWGYAEEAAQFSGLDIVVGVDVSRSMLAEDLLPSRLDRAKLALQSFAEGRRGDRLGLIAFAGNAFLQCPLTLDRNAFIDTLRALEAGMLPGKGTDLSAAVREAARTFPEDSPEPVMIILTDGEDLSGNAAEAAEAAAAEGVTVFTVGVGTTEGILLRDANGRRILDPQGEPVISRLDPATLQRLAEAAGGFYAPLGATGEGLRAVSQAMDRFSKSSREERTQRRRIDRFQWPLAFAVLCLLVDACVNPLRRPQMRESGQRSVAAAVCLTLVLAFVLATPVQAAADADNDLAADSTELSSLSRTARPRDFFNAGTELMATNELDAAERAFGMAILRGDLALQARGYFNLAHLNARRTWPRHQEWSEWPALQHGLAEALGQADAAEAHGEQVYDAATRELPEMLRREPPPTEAAIRQALAQVEQAGGMLEAIQAPADAELAALADLRDGWKEAREAFAATAKLDPGLSTQASENRDWVEARLGELPSEVEESAARAHRARLPEQQAALEDLAERLRSLLPDPPPSDDSDSSGESDQSDPSEGEDSNSEQSNQDQSQNPSQNDGGEQASGESSGDGSGPSRAEDQAQDGQPSQEESTEGEPSAEEESMAANDPNTAAPTASSDADETDSQADGELEGEDASPEGDAASALAQAQSQSEEDAGTPEGEEAGDVVLLQPGQMRPEEAQRLLEEWERRGSRRILPFVLPPPEDETQRDW